MYWFVCSHCAKKVKSDSSSSYSGPSEICPRLGNSSHSFYCIGEVGDYATYQCTECGVSINTVNLSPNGGRCDRVGLSQCHHWVRK